MKSGAHETVVDNECKTALQRLDGGILHPNLHSYTKQIQEDVDLARTAGELLANAPADRADNWWRRRALLVLCIARHRRGKAQLLEGWVGNARDDCARVAAWVLDAGLGMGMKGVFRMIVGYL